MGYSKTRITFNEPRLSLYDSGAVSFYTEYIHGENNYRYANPNNPDSFIVLEGELELVIDGIKTKFIKGDHINIEAGTPHGPVLSDHGALILVIHRRSSTDKA